MKVKNKYVIRSRISEKKFREIIKYFSIDLKLRFVYKPVIITHIMIQICRGMAQPGSASGLGPEGREFKSLCPDHL